MSDISEKRPVAVITGGASGIGNACARMFSPTHHVVIADMNRAKEAAMELENPGTGLPVDVADDESCRNLAAEVSRLGPVTVLVHCAGICPPPSRIEALDTAQWKKVMDVNLNGAFLLARAFIPVLEDGASVVLLASRAGRTGIGARELTQPSHADYCTSKAAVISLTKSLAFELAPRRIRVNAVAPGPVLTAMAVARRDPEEIARTIPLGRQATTEDITPAIGFLCSEGASWITGHTLDINGGMTM